MTGDAAGGMACPLPHPAPPVIAAAHGGGGRAMHQLLERVFYPALDNPALAERGDAATFMFGNQRAAFTTDAFVVQPLFFPGGDIGALAVHGTVNDLAMMGARPIALSAAFLLEEGLPLVTLAAIAASMRSAADACGVSIVTGDTKVVGRTGADPGLMISMAGIGTIAHPLPLTPSGVRPGDAVLVSGDLGRHGIAVMAARAGMDFDPPVTSDSAPLTAPALALVDAGLPIHAMRDLTRGGLTAALHEMANAASVSIIVEEAAVPISDSVRGASELLGIDSLFAANEGRFAVFLPESHAAEALHILAEHALGTPPARVAAVGPRGTHPVLIDTVAGTRRLLDLPTGEQLPRIC